ncbi:MAG TPA: carboxypeptidase regulatory-like domain-containing protein [Pyrinomonadaceae bacterium]|nr:carboxypeptidase regulatory-like domain-containing protein [Pyrinomonadaceae bacterium]
MKRLTQLKTVALVMLLTLAFSGVASSQEITGNLSGTVKDTTGAVVKGATVTITDVEKQVVVRTVTTGDEGEWSAQNLPAGLYTVEVEATGFKKAVQSNIKLDVGQRRAVETALEAGSISETVMVATDPVAVELATATASSLVSGDQVRELSLNNRNWVQLVALSPGVSNDLADQVYVGTTNPEGQANTINISVNGARSSQNTFTVDGADITDRGSNITIQAYPSVDSIGEFRVLRSLFPAESGRSGGGQVNVVTRSGTNEFHGSIFEFLRNEKFNANNFLLNATRNPPFGREDNGKAKRPPFRYNNWGWTIGGPVYFPRFGEGPSDEMIAKVPRTFFFFSQEFRRDRRFTSASTVTVPDANLRRGVFPIPVCINRPALGETSCTGQFILPAGTPIPSNLLSPAAQAYVNGIYNRLPLPNAATAAAPFNLAVSLANRADFDQTIIKIDHTVSDNLSFYYRFQKDSIPTLDANSLFSSGGGLPNVSTTSTNSPGKTHTANMTYVLNPRTVIEGRYTFGYGAILSENVGLLALQNTSIPISLPFENTRDRNPSVTGNGFTGLTSFGPYDNFSWKQNFAGTLTSIMGSHTFKYGAAYSLYRKNENALAGNNEGLFSAFSNTQPTGVSTSTLNQNIQRWANFLVGNAQTFAQAHFDYTADLRQKAFEAFAQDEWKARPNLTLYLGVRYSYFPGPYDKNGRLTTFVPELYDPAQAPLVTGAGNRVAGTGNWCNGIIVNEQNFTTGPAQFNCRPTVSPFGKYVIDSPKHDFAPRIGIAWDPFGNGRTSIRTGYGIYHEQVLVGTYLQNIGLNPPFQETATATNTRLDNPGGGIPTNLTVQSLRAVQSDWHTPYMQHWSLDVQHQVGSNTVFTIGYYGSKGTHLIGLTELNEVPPGRALNSLCAPGNTFIGQNPAPTLVACQPAGYAFRNTSAATGNPNVVGSTLFSDLLILDQLRPFKGFRSIAMVQPRYNSNYHALQFSARQRLTGSSLIDVAYTWSKNLTDSPNDRTTSPQNSYDIRSEYQRATLDRRHIFTLNYVYELPFFRTQQGFTGRVLGGWQASGIVTVNTGLPFSVTTSNLDLAGLGLINANPAARPNLLCDPNENAPHDVQWVTNQCFQLNPTNTAVGLTNAPGTTPRGVIDGPPTQRVDLSMMKNLRFTERFSAQIRAEAFNIFNHTNFRNISTNITATNFGAVTTVRDPRTMQFGLKLMF